MRSSLYNHMIFWQLSELPVSKWFDTKFGQQEILKARFQFRVISKDKHIISNSGVFGKMLLLYFSKGYSHQIWTQG